MTKLSERISSLREQVGANYERPSPDKLKLFREELTKNEIAMAYLEATRGLTKETIDHFQLGYDPDRDAIAIPVFKRGELINIKYRFLNPVKIKYSGERNAESWIYNEEGIKNGIAKGSIIIVEGEFDLMSIWQSGSINVVSPSAGKEAFGVWIEYLDSIPKIYIAYDNDAPGKDASIRLAERLGTDKCFEILYPEGIKDANEFFKSHTKEDFRALPKNARPYYTHQFKGLGDVIRGMMENKEVLLTLNHLPKVKMEKDWLVVISGVSNVGKTAYVLNLVDELTIRGIPTLVMPFERGVESVGGRFLQVKFNKDTHEMTHQSKQEWADMIDKCVDAPVYFAVPSIKDVIPTIAKSKRIFDTKVVVIDHIDYLIRNISGNKEAAIGDMLKDLKKVAIEHGIIMLVVSHLKKLDNAGGWKTPRKPCLDDLKGSSSLYQDPEAVVMLSSEEKGTLYVEVQKNKGEMCGMTYNFNERTGKITGEFDEFVMPKAKQEEYNF